MKREQRVCVAALALVLLQAGCAHVGGHPWAILLDGDKGLDGWNRFGDANWRAADGAIVADAGKGGHLVSRGSYADFELRAEFWAATNTNSGVFLRCADPANISQASCYEVNIYDQRPDQRYATGAIVDTAAVAVPLQHKAGGQWNRFEISARGTELTVKLNGAVTVQVMDGKHASGPITLQYGAGPNGAQSGVIKWRKVQIRPL